MSELKQRKIEEYDIVSFVMQIQQGIRDGYEVTDKSEESPMCIGHCYHVIMREAAKPNVVIGKAVFESSIDTTKLQEQLKKGGEVEQMLAGSLVVDEMTAIDDFLLVSDDIKEALSSGIVEDVKIEDLQAVETPVKQTTKRGKKQ